VGPSQITDRESSLNPGAVFREDSCIAAGSMQRIDKRLGLAAANE
jgi:hypothetical protein